MAEFAGYNMPISYSGINDETRGCTKNAGVFDVSHMGEFILKGPPRWTLIQRVTSNDASKLKAGQAQYSCSPNRDGGILSTISWCIVLKKTRSICWWSMPPISRKTGTGSALQQPAGGNAQYSEKTRLLAVRP